MRRTDPTDPEHTTISGPLSNVPAMGSPEWEELRRRQTAADDGSTRKFQAHRAPVRAKGATMRQTPEPSERRAPGLVVASVALCMLIFQPTIYAEAVQSGDRYARWTVVVFTVFAAYLVLSWVRNLVIWHRGR